MKKKAIIIISAIIVVIGLIALAGYLFINYSTGTDFVTIGVSKADLTENQFTAHLMTSSSGTAFQKYEYEIKDDSLYITVWSGLVNKKYSSGEMDIKIKDDLSNIKSVYLKDKDNTKLIYSKEEQQPQDYTDLGTEEIYTSKDVWPDTNLTLRISNVKEVKTGTNTDGMETWETKTYVVYPSAKVTIENADMTLNIDDEKYSQWAFLKNPDNNERIDIVDNMQPIQITNDILCVYHIEGYITGIYFEIAEPELN